MFSTTKLWGEGGRYLGSIFLKMFNLESAQGAYYVEYGSRFLMQRFFIIVLCIWEGQVMD